MIAGTGAGWNRPETGASPPIFRRIDPTDASLHSVRFATFTALPDFRVSDSGGDFTYELGTLARPVEAPTAWQESNAIHLWP